MLIANHNLKTKQAQQNINVHVINVKGKQTTYRKISSYLFINNLQIKLRT